MLRLCGTVNHMPVEGRRSDSRKDGEGNKTTGREGQLLAVAKEEGQVLGKAHLTQMPTAGDGREMSLSLLHHQETSQD